MNKGWTNRPVITLRTDALLEEALQATYDTGYLADKNAPDELKAATVRRKECFAEIENRLKGRKS